MSEPAYKRRLRAWEKRLIAQYKAQGYDRVERIESGAFHLLARKGKSGVMIRISFENAHFDEILMVKREPVPEGCVRKVHKVSTNGLGITTAKID